MTENLKWITLFLSASVLFLLYASFWTGSEPKDEVEAFKATYSLTISLIGAITTFMTSMGLIIFSAFKTT